MAKRAYRSGTLYQRASDGRWIGSLPDGHGGRARYVTGTDKAKVERRLADLARSSTSRRRPASETVTAYLGRWLDDAARTTLRPRTVGMYRAVMEHHIVPVIGRTRIADLEPADVSRMIRAVLDGGRSPQTAKHAHKVLRVALGQAVRWGLLERNVAALVRSPRVPRPTIVALSAEDARRLVELTREHPRWPLWTLALTTGMRRGELLALRWPDVDAKAGTLTVNATLRQVSRWKFAFDPPKTDRSRRTLRLPRLAAEALRQQLAAATSVDVVFARPDGRPLPPAEVTREFKAELVRLGLPEVTFHSLRHTAAQLMLDRTAGDIRAVSAQLGHSTISTTVDIYGGVADEARRRATAAMDDAMEGIG